jgi:ornithine cyclodeaminase/alanine dehydrogenase-like protein (mu-crystallin family)
MMKFAFGQLSAGQATVPIRTRIPTEKGDTLFMPVYLHRTQDLGIKIVSVYGDNPSLGLPTVSATVLVLDSQTGLPRAFMDGTSLTAIRTGAAGGLASEVLARPDAKTIALFGAGVQARSQLQAVMVVRRVTHVNIFDSSPELAQELKQEISTWSSTPSVNVVVEPQQAIQDADIVITATNSSTPVFDGNDIKPGTHITGIGSYTPQMQEVDEVTVRRAIIVVDSREACLAEAGDIIIPKAEIYAEMGEIINGLKPGRQSDDEITFFKSVGIAVQDAVAATAVLQEAEEKGLGMLVEMS